MAMKQYFEIEEPKAIRGPHNPIEERFQLWT